MDCAAKGSGTPCAQGPPSRRCGLCGAVAYCSLAHQKSHWNDHKKECARLEQQMRNANTLNDFPFTFSMEATTMGLGNQGRRCSLLMSHGIHHKGPWKFECSCSSLVASSNNLWSNDYWNLESALCPCTDPKSRKAHLHNWKDYYHWRCLPFHSPVSLLLHWPLTIYHCIQLAVTKSLITNVSDKLNIHYLGPDKELRQLAVLGELRALFPGIKLHIECIGPAIPQFRDGETIHISNYACCSEESCHCKSVCSNYTQKGFEWEMSVVTIKLHKGFYHEVYKDIKEDSDPQLILAPNAGVAAYPSWLPTIQVIKEINIPAIFTDFCEEAANLAAHCITSATGRPLRLPIQVNPFRQPMMVEDSALYLPCYSNCFLFGM